MNPVLLKPTSHVGSQVIVLGRPVGQMRVGAYLRYKPEAWKAVRRAYRELSSGMDVMVLEGAGSPAEINLRAHDIVNMRMARHAEAHVLLVADIDRGGAFASLVGTMSLLGRADRARVAGYVLNKFRGDATLLDPALEAVSRRTRRPFLGVMPMLEDLRLPEEDSVSFKLGITPGLDAADGDRPAAPDCLDIALVDLPHISNFTDLDALRAEADVRLRIVRHADELGAPDAVILPGSKNSIADMRFLRRTGVAEALRGYAERCRNRGALVGICGGLQMLGQSIADPLGLEEGGLEPGLDLLPLRTELGGAKLLRRTGGRALAGLAGEELAVRGYEIHHGRSVPAEERPGGAGGMPLTPVMTDEAGRTLGWGLPGADGAARVWGTYLHGVFDADAFRRAFLNRLRRERGLAPRTGTVYSLGPELDRLADAVEANLDMAAIYAMLGL